MGFWRLIVVLCLSHASGSADGDKYNCFTKEAWTEEKRDWCCKEQQLGCKKDCNQKAACASDICPDGKPRRHIGTDCCSCGEIKCGDEALVVPNASCGRGGLECPGDSWCDAHSNDAGAVCCKKKDEYDCFTKETWAEEKREWCCKEQQLGCMDDEKTKKPDRYKCFTQEVWSEEKRDWCCQEQQLGCKDDEKTKKPDGYNCFTREKWTEEKRAWCCKNKQLGCKEDEKTNEPYRYNCFTKEAWTEEKRDWCCKEQQLGCKKDDTTKMVMQEDGSTNTSANSTDSDGSTNTSANSTDSDGSTNTSANSTDSDFLSSATPHDCALVFLFAWISSSFPS